MTRLQHGKVIIFFILLISLLVLNSLIGCLQIPNKVYPCVPFDLPKIFNHNL